MPIRQRKLGWKRNLPDHRDYKLVHASTSLISRPVNFSLEDQMPPIWDQKETNSCVAHACAAAFEFNILNKPKWTPSRLFIYYNSRLIEGTQNTDDGTQIRDAIKGLASFGVGEEADWPFDEKQINVKPSMPVYVKAFPNKVASYLSVIQPFDKMDKRIDLICSTIANGEPVIFGASLYDSFESDEVEKTGIVPMPKATEGMIGGHAMLIVGYSDEEKMFTVRNSWNTDWGIKGYCKMPYAYISNPSLAEDFTIIRTIL